MNFDITPADLEVLHLLYSNPGASLQELERLLSNPHVKIPVVVCYLRKFRLVRGAWRWRAEDGKRYRLHLTDRGKHAVLHGDY